MIKSKHNHTKLELPGSNSSDNNQNIIEGAQELAFKGYITESIHNLDLLSDMLKNDSTSNYQAFITLSQANHDLAKCELQNGNLTKCLDIIKTNLSKLQKYQPKSELIQQNLLLQSEALIYQSSYKEAQKVIDRILKTNESSLETSIKCFYLKSKLYLQIQNLQKAHEYIIKARSQENDKQGKESSQMKLYQFENNLQYIKVLLALEDYQIAYTELLSLESQDYLEKLPKISKLELKIVRCELLYSIYHYTDSAHEITDVLTDMKKLNLNQSRYYTEALLLKMKGVIQIERNYTNLHDFFKTVEKVLQETNIYAQTDYYKVQFNILLGQFNQNFEYYDQAAISFQIAKDSCRQDNFINYSLIYECLYQQAQLLLDIEDYHNAEIRIKDCFEVVNEYLNKNKQKLVDCLILEAKTQSDEFLYEQANKTLIEAQTIYTVQNDNKGKNSKNRQYINENKAQSIEVLQIKNKLAIDQVYQDAENYITRLTEIFEEKKLKLEQTQNMFFLFKAKDQ